MSKKRFYVSSEDTTIITHSWNLAKKEMANLIQDLSQKSDEDYYLKSSDTLKDPNSGHYIKGKFTYGCSSGKCIEITIEKDLEA